MGDDDGINWSVVGETTLFATGVMFAIVFGGGTAVILLHLVFGIFGLDVLPPC